MRMKRLIRNYLVHFGEHTPLACSDRRPRRPAECVLNGEDLTHPLSREGAEQHTRGAYAPHFSLKR